MRLQVVQDLAGPQGKGRLDGLVGRARHYQHPTHCHCPYCLHLRDLCEERHLTETVAHSLILPAQREVHRGKGGCKGVRWFAGADMNSTGLIHRCSHCESQQGLEMQCASEWEPAFKSSKLAEALAFYGL